MPRAIVMLRGNDWKSIRDELSNIVRKRDNAITNETGVIVECFLEAFGWSDFIVLLWGNNVEQIKKAIIQIRENCNAFSSTIIGVTEEEIELRTSELVGSLPKTRSKKLVDDSDFLQNKIDNIFKDYIDLIRKQLTEMENELKERMNKKKDN